MREMNEERNTDTKRKCPRVPWTRERPWKAKREGGGGGGGGERKKKKGR